MILNILQWNIKGYQNNYLELETIAKHRRPHIICLQETHIRASYSPHCPKQYASYFHNFPNTNYSKQGCGLLVHKNIPHRKININSNLLVIAIEFNIKYPITVMSLYIPPNQKFSQLDLSQLTSAVNTPIIICGDFNGWSPLWGSPHANHRGTIIEDFILSSDLCILNDNSPTHFSTHKTFTHVDLTLCSPQLLPIASWHTLEDLHNSDHFPIISTFSISNSITPCNNRVSKYNTAKANWTKFQNMLHANNLPDFDEYNPNKEAAIIQRAIRTVANQTIPVSAYRRSSGNVPWWSAELSVLRNEKIKAWREYQRHPNPDSLTAYRKCNARFNREKKLAKTKSFEDFSGKLNPSSSTRDIWKGIQTLTGTYSPRNITTITTNNSTITESQEIALRFAQYISRSSETSNFPPQFIASSINIPEMNAANVTDTLALSLESDINLNEIDLALKTTKGNTPGFDKIDYAMIRKIPFSLKNRLLLLYNSIFNQGIIPQSFKTAVIVPILKPQKDPSDITSYRPISLIPCISKIMEKIISKRLMWFLKTKKLLTPFQTGFKSGTSTLDALIFLDHHVSKQFSVKNHTSILSIDFSKAFDKIGGHVILKKLQDWKVGAKIFNYIKSFLSNRRFRSKVNSYFSPTLTLHNGIPQGSPLSVTLFLIAFEDISKIISQQKNIKHCLYADDLFLLSDSKQIRDIENSFKNALSAIDAWSQHSGAFISFEKCKHLHVCKKHNCCQLKLQYNNKLITNTNCMKILGVLFDNKNSFKYHCIQLRSDLATRLSIVKYLSSRKALCIQIRYLT